MFQVKSVDHIEVFWVMQKMLLKMVNMNGCVDLNETYTSVCI
jgi:hypothetical protein